MSTPDLEGVVLAGGSSRRMGFDKRLIAYHLKPESFRVYLMLESVCGRAKMLVDSEKLPDLNPKFRYLLDPNPGQGPLAALCNALETSDANLFVLPIDTPALEIDALQSLVEAYRADNKAKTVDAFLFCKERNATPEPVMGIWHKSALPILKKAMADGQRSLVRLFPQLKIQTHIPADPFVLTNANDPATKAELERWLAQRNLDAT